MEPKQTIDGYLDDYIDNLEKIVAEWRGVDKMRDIETRVIDPVTGGEKGSKITRFDLIPPEFEDALARHYGEGAKKYDDRNWERGYKWGLSLRAARTHLNQWQLGERYDEETKTHHLISAIWHLIALYIFDIRGLGTNDLSPKM